MIGYLAPPAGSLAARLPRPPALEPRRLMTWSTVVLAVAFVAFLIFFVDSRGWRDPGEFFLRSKGRLEQLVASPAATSKYFLASILLMVPVALFFLSIRIGEGGSARMRRIAGWAALVSILAFLRLQLLRGAAPLRDRHGGGPRALLLPEARPAPLGAQPR